MSHNHYAIMNIEENIYAILDQVAETGIPSDGETKRKNHNDIVCHDWFKTGLPGRTPQFSSRRS